METPKAHGTRRALGPGECIAKGRGEVNKRKGARGACESQAEGVPTVGPWPRRATLLRVCRRIVGIGYSLSGMKPTVVLGANIRCRRESAGLSQEALALHAGIHRTYIGSVERGERNVSLLNIVRIARALRCPPGDLLEGILLEDRDA